MKKISNIFSAAFNYFRWKWRFYDFGLRSRLIKPEMLTNTKSIKIGKRVEIRKHARLETFGPMKDNKPKLTIGDGTSIHLYFHCGAAESVTIGKDVLMASRIYISDHDHEFDNPEIAPVNSRKLITKPVTIEDGVWIGEGAVILKGVTIGKRSVIGANSVVTKDIPPYHVAAGVPAKIIKKIEGLNTNEQQ